MPHCVRAVQAEFSLTLAKEPENFYALTCRSID